ncbi:MAG: site-specific integrase [Syntrophorhabdales bacterium]
MRVVRNAGGLIVAYRDYRFCQKPDQKGASFCSTGMSGNGRTSKSDPFPGVPGFFRYLREERGLRETSIWYYQFDLRSFEGYLGRIGLHDLSELSRVALGAFLVEHCSDLSPFSCTGLLSSIRVFLRYLFREGIIKRDLS